MKRQTVIFFTIVYLAASSFSCSSLGKNEQNGPVVPPERKAAENRSVLPEGWIFEKEITHEGSRSEGSVSRLFYRYNEIPPVFNRIIIGKYTFDYTPMHNIWDNYGYKENNEDTVTVSEFDESINRNDLKKGWYAAGADSKKTGTPSDWIWVATDKLAFWVFPEKINDLVTFFGFNPVSELPRLLAPAE